jgi:hypothetical protein
MHVLDPVKDNLDQVRVEYGGEKYVPKLLKSLPGPYPDLALLHVDVVGHPCVFLDPVLDPGAALYVYGFTARYPAGEPSTVEYEGPAMLDSGLELLKFKGGQIVPGLSGAPLLNMSTWSVAGMVKSTRDRASDLGGGGIPAKVILSSLPELASIQQMFHSWDRRWLTASQKQRERKTTDGYRPMLVVSIAPAQAPKRSGCVEVDESRMQARTILDALWCPQALAWFAPNSIALGSRDSFLRIGAPDGRIVAEYPVPVSYPSDVTVHDGRFVAAICYTKLLWIDLVSGEQKIAELDDGASTYCVRWSPKGDFLAAGGSNDLKIFDRDLTVIAEHHVAGRHGAPALAWTHDGKLHVALGNGEVWLLEAPFAEHEIEFKNKVGAHALECSADDRLAYLWEDGVLEIRRSAEVVSSVAMHAPDARRAGGPKVVWCLDDSAIARTIGSSEISFWRIGAESYAMRRMERQVLALALSPDGLTLAAGIDEKQREDARVQTIPMSDIAAAIDTPPQESEKAVEPHLFQADWSALIDSVAQQQRIKDAAAFTIRLDIPYLESRLNDYEELIRKADADATIKRQLGKYLERARESANKILDDLLWAVHQMQEAGYGDHEIATVCDRFVSFTIISILGRLGLQDFPRLEKLTKFVAFVLGYLEDDVVDLGFDAYDGRGFKAIVPFEFLAEVQNLREVGQALGNKYGAKTPRQQVMAACQLFHDFDYSFDYHHQRELWTRFVLPQALLRYPRENLIVKPSDVEHFGLS